MIIPRYRFRAWSPVQILVFASLLYILLVMLLFPRWTVDDAYISMRYAENLVQHGQVTWNVGDAPVEGYTGILLVWIYAATLRFGGDPVLIGRLVGGESLVACGILIWLLLQHLGATRKQQAVGVALFCVQPWWIIHAYAGLETLLFTALVLGCFLAFFRRWHTALMVLLFLTSLTRPEGAALAFVLLVAGWHRGDRWRTIAPALALYVLPGAIYFVWRWSYYGQFLPNTFYAKSAGDGWRDGLYFVINQGMLIWALWASRPTRARLQQHRLVSFAALGFVGILFVVYSRSDLLMNYAERFFMPVLAIGLIGIVLSFGSFRRAWLPLAGYAGMCVLLLLIYGFWCSMYENMEQREHSAVAAWLNEHADPDSTVAVIVDAGLVPYRTGLRTIDFGALNDTYLAHHPEPADRVDYFFQQSPEYVMLANGKLGIDTAERFRAMLLADPRWHTCYILGHTFNDGPADYHQALYTEVPGCHH